MIDSLRFTSEVVLCEETVVYSLKRRWQDLRWHLDHRTPPPEPDFGLSLKQLYEFDLQGFVRIERFLSSDQVALMNQVIDAEQKRRFYIKFPFLDLHGIFFDVMSHAKSLEICRQLCGDHFRLDEAMGVQELPEFAGKDPRLYNLHAGPMDEQGSFQYHWYNGRPYCTHVQFVYILHPVRAGDGGLVFVAGSHKQNLKLSGWDIQQHLLGGSFDAPWIVNPELEAGDLVIFTEATVHGTRPWKPKDRPRRNLYYKYCPGYAAWRDYEQMKPYLALARNDVERRILRPPYVARYDDADLGLRENDWRRPTV
jgi:hypothetical protein